jgi:hypothetical protein
MDDAASAELEGADHGSEEAGDGGLLTCPIEVRKISHVTMMASLALVCLLTLD